MSTDAAVLVSAIKCLIRILTEQYLQRTSSRPFVETLAYDSVWTLAFALNRTMNMININDTLDCGPSPVPLEEFSYGNSSTACLIRRSLSATNFTGLSVSVDSIHLHTLNNDMICSIYSLKGPVLFGSSGERKQDTVRLLQYRVIMVFNSQ